MNRPIIARIMYGMWGPATDPGARIFTDMVRSAIPGINLGRSPYRDYDVQEIVSDLNHSVTEAIRFVIGSSLGANNCPVVGYRARPTTIHGIFGFQASTGGAKQPITPNVLFAHEFYNPLCAMTFWMGCQKWQKEPMNVRTGLVLTPEYAMHPGETAKAMNAFLAEMKRIIKNPGD